MNYAHFRLMTTELHYACILCSSLYKLLLLCSLCFKCCLGALEDLVSTHKAVLHEKQQQALHLEEKEQQLQQEVSSRKRIHM